MASLLEERPGVTTRATDMQQEQRVPLHQRVSRNLLGTLGLLVSTSF